MSEKILHYCLVGLTICFGGYLLARGCLYLRENSSENAHKVLGIFCQNIEETALELYFPQYMKFEKSHKSWIEENIMGNLSPLLQYIQKNSLQETMAENQNITNEIIKLHNKLLLDEVLSENQNLTGQNQNSEELEITEGVKQENIQQIVTPTPEIIVGEDEEKSEELPVWAQLSAGVINSDISIERLKDFDYLLQEFFIVDANTNVHRDMFSVEQLTAKSMKVEKQNAPQILIYHTHSQEGYADSVEGDEETTVVGVGNYLKYLLEEVFGYQVIHLKDSFDMVEGYLERSRAYDYALPVISQVLAEYPTIEVVIDLHRDGVDENRRLVTEINGKPTAKIMFFNGLSRTSDGESRTSIPNPNLLDNLAFSFQLAYEAKKYYPDFTRCVYLKGYRYNLHVRPKAILLEVGAQTNTIQEAKNAMEPFSVILNKVLNEE